jgi:hypothetical protein
LRRRTAGIEAGRLVAPANVNCGITQPKFVPERAYAM